MLTPEQKRNRIRTLTRADLGGFKARIITHHRIIHHFNPETKATPKQCYHTSSPTPRKFKITKVMVPVTWDQEGILRGPFFAHTTGEVAGGGGLSNAGKATIHLRTRAMSKVVSCGFAMLHRPLIPPIFDLLIFTFLDT